MEEIFDVVHCPTALGIYVTLVLVKLTFHYYAIAAHGNEASHEQGVSGVLYLAHQKSIDYRLRARGPRQVSPNLALLTVDERALATIGRWPWPREVLAKALDNAFKFGAKLVAFDMIFSEPSLNPAERVLQAMRQEGKADPALSNALNSYTERMDSDKAMGSAFTRYADHIVAGSFYNNTLDTGWPPETEFCRDMIFKLTPAAKQWDHEEVLLSVNDPYQPYMPAALTQVFQTVLQEKEKAVREHFGTPKNKNEEVKLANEVQAALHDTCNTILDDFREALSQQWKTVVLTQENAKDFTFPTYDAWLADFRGKSWPNGVIFANDWVMNTPKSATEPNIPPTLTRNKIRTERFATKLWWCAPATRTFRRCLSKPIWSPTGTMLRRNWNSIPLVYLKRLKEIVDMEITNNDTGNTVMHVPTDHKGKACRSTMPAPIQCFLT